MENQTLIEKMPLIKYGELLKNSWKLFKEKWKKMFPLLAIEAIPLLAYSYYGDNFVLFVISFIVSVWIGLSILYILKDDSIDYSKALKLGWEKISSGIWIAILNLVAILGGLILLVIPGIIFMIWFYFSQYILIFEDKKGKEALIASKKLVKGNWWNVFGKMMILILYIFAVMFCIMIPVGIILGDNGSSFASTLVSIFLISPFTSIYFYLFYKDLKRLKAE
jgi:hypothetical protein